MNTSFKQMDNKQKALNSITKYRVELKNHGFECWEIEEKQYHYEFSSNLNRIKNKILVYFGKKGVKTVIQGNPTSKEYQEINSIVSGNYSFNFEIIPEKEYDQYIGTDETGKGDFFGPLVIAGFFVDEKVISSLIKFGVRDSKELTDFQINRIANQIRKKFPKNFSIISIHPEKYNQLYEKFKNVNKLLDWAHSKAIENLYQLKKTKTVIVDQFSKKPLSISTTHEFSDVEFVSMPKAEKHLGVAAASILARNEMNKWFMNKQEEGFNLPKGASNGIEDVAKQIYLKGGKDKLASFIKLHFKTTKKIFEG